MISTLRLRQVVPPKMGSLLHRASVTSSAFRGSARSVASAATVLRPPARVGGSVDSVETPALLVDLDAFERNCLRLKDGMEEFPGVSVRPHCKAHKCAEVALLQMKLLGAKGVCCQKLTEVEAMVEGGVADVLLSNEVVSVPKIRRLLELAKSARLGLCVDNMQNVKTISDEACRAGSSIQLIVDCNVGQDRCGVDTPEEALALTETILEAPGVSFGGLQAYHGGIQHVRSEDDRAAAVHHVAQRAQTFVDALSMRNIPIPVVTGAGTGTYKQHADSGVFNEVQPGSFCFGDADYSRNRNADGSLGEWEQSLWVLATVMSRNEGANRVVLDAGLKAISLDSGPPIVPESQTDGVVVEFKSGGDEHGVLLWPEVWQMPTALPALGSLVKLMPGHCDPTVNLYDWLVAYRGSTVEHVWAIRGRGPGL